MRRTVLAVAVASLLTALGACSSKDKVVDPPAELADFPATLRVQRAWDASVGGKGDKLRLGLGVATDDGRVYAAGHAGEVSAWDLETGKSLWKTRTKAPLSGDTGAGEGLVVVGSSEGAIIALNEKDGAERWRVKVNGEVLAAAAISPRAVLVRTVDGKLHSLAPDTGKEQWQYEQLSPRLTLRGTAKPVVHGDTVICGFDNGKVVALNIPDGSLVWETTIGSAHGRTELERLVDIDSAVRIVQDNVYAVGFQGRVAMLALDSGQIWWAQDASSYRGLAADDDTVYVSTADGDVVALKRTTGIEVWRQKGLAHRGLSAPVVLDKSIAVADFKGYVHWLDKTTGAFVGRATAGGDRVSNPPVAVGDRVLVINDDGRVTAFKTSPITLAAAKIAAPKPAAAPAQPAAERLETGVPPSIQRRGPPSPSEPIEKPAQPAEPAAAPAPAEPAPAAAPAEPATAPAEPAPSSGPAPAPPQRQ